MEVVKINDLTPSQREELSAELISHGLARGEFRAFLNVNKVEGRTAIYEGMEMKWNYRLSNEQYEIAKETFNKKKKELIKELLKKVPFEKLVNYVANVSHPNRLLWAIERMPFLVELDVKIRNKVKEGGVDFSLLVAEKIEPEPEIPDFIKFGDQDGSQP